MHIAMVMATFKSMTRLSGESFAIVPLATLGLSRSGLHSKKRGLTPMTQITSGLEEAM